MKTIEDTLRELPPPLVGSFGLLEKGKIEVRDSCVEMFKYLRREIDPRCVFEIGTHSGYSAAFFLTFTRAFVISVDIGKNWIGCDHSFSDWGVRCPGGLMKVTEVLRANFPGRFFQIISDSTNQEFKTKTKENFNGLVDLAFIDGNHDYEYVLSDIMLMKEIGVKLFLLDDFGSDSVEKAIEDSSLKVTKIFESVHNSCNINVGLCSV